jgi:hypothetical protein
MKSISFWAREAQLLPALDREYLKEAIEMLLSWEPLRKEYGELDILRRMLEPEMEEYSFTDGSSEEENQDIPKVLHHSYKKI